VGRRAALLFLLALGLAACGSTTQAVTGVLVEEGGPSPANHTLVSGDIKLLGPHGTYTAVAARNGRFSLDAPPGAYHIQGRPAHWTGSAGYPCGGQQVILKAGTNIQTTVACVFP
jgi:hypothetical protein